MTDRPPEDNNLVITAGGCGGRVIGLAALAIVVVAAAVILLPKLFTTDDVFADIDTPIAGAVGVGRPFATVLPSPSDDIDVLTVTPLQRAESAPAVVDVLACSDVGQQVARMPDLRALRQLCPTPVPTPGLEIGPDDQLVLVVVPLAEGEILIDSVDVTRSDRWRHVTESIDLELVVTGTPPAG